MRRLAVVAVLAALTLSLVPSTLATAPSRERSVYTVEETRLAGTQCDFDYHLDTTVKSNFSVFGDPESRIHWQAVQVTTHTNLATGYALTETAAIAETFDIQTGVDKLVGVAWHLRDADGKLVVVQAGQMIIDYSADPPVVLKATPHMDPDWAGIICPALGGHPS